MSRVLPAELKTKKTDSLPKELKSIAEELIADKFGIKEEVVPTRDDFFLDINRTSQVRDEPRMDFGFNRHIAFGEDWQTRRRVASVAVSYPDERSLVHAFRALDAAIPHRRERRIVCSREFFNELMRDPALMMVSEPYNRPPRLGESPRVARIYGYDVIVSPALITHCVVEDIGF